MPSGYVHIIVILTLFPYCSFPTCTIYSYYCSGILLAFLGHPYELSAHPWFGIVVCTGGRPRTGAAVVGSSQRRGRQTQRSLARASPRWSRWLTRPRRTLMSSDGYELRVVQWTPGTVRIIL